MSAEPFVNLLRGTKADLLLVRKVRKLISASSDRETVRRMAIFCSVLLEHQQARDCQIVLCRKGQPDQVAWIL